MFKSFRFPWKKREEEEKRLRQDAERKRAEVEADWVTIRQHRGSIAREVALNDWTSTAVTFFTGSRER